MTSSGLFPQTWESSCRPSRHHAAVFTGWVVLLMTRKLNCNSGRLNKMNGWTPIKRVKVNWIERDREGERESVMGGETPPSPGGSSTNITVHLFLLITEPDLCQLITSTYVHELIWKIASITQADRFVPVRMNAHPQTTPTVKCVQP